MTDPDMVALGRAALWAYMPASARRAFTETAAREQAQLATLMITPPAFHEAIIKEAERRGQVMRDLALTSSRDHMPCLQYGWESVYRDVAAGWLP